MRILYLGLPLGLEWLRRHGFSPTIAASFHLDALGKRRAYHGSSLFLERPDPRAEWFRKLVRSSQCDTLLSWYWPRQIPKELLELFPGRAFNLHPALLPILPGPDPFYWAIREGHERSGVTLHALVEAFDQGEIAMQRSIAIDALDTGWTLARKLDRPSLALLAEAAKSLEMQTSLPGKAHSIADSFWARVPTDHDLALDFSRPAAELARWVRAASPWPGASAWLEDELWVIEAAHASEMNSTQGHGLGEAFLTQDGLVAVQTSYGSLVLDAVRFEASGLEGAIARREVQAIAELFPALR